jgi:hypothetical protein
MCLIEKFCFVANWLGVGKQEALVVGSIADIKIRRRALNHAAVT